MTAINDATKVEENWEMMLSGPLEENKNSCANVAREKSCGALVVGSVICLLTSVVLISCYVSPVWLPIGHEVSHLENAKVGL